MWSTFLRFCPAVILWGCLVAPLEAQPLLRPRDDSGRLEAFPYRASTSLLQDRRGYLWGGSYGGGLHRYDGYEVKNYRPEEGDSTSLSSDWIFSLLEASDGSLWIGTGEGLNRFNHASGRFRRYRHPIHDVIRPYGKVVAALAETSDGMLWFGTDGMGLFRMDPLTETLHNYRQGKRGEKGTASRDRISALHASPDGILWIGTADGLSSFDPRDESFRHFPFTENGWSNPVGRTVTVLSETSDGRLWVGTDGGLRRFNLGTRSFESQIEGSETPMLAGKNVLALHEFGNGEMWIGTEEGLFTLELLTDRLRPYHGATSDGMRLRNHTISVIHQTSDGIVWTGTGEGLVRLDPARDAFRRYLYQPDNDAIPNQEWISALHESKDGRLWLGSAEVLTWFDQELETFSDDRFQVARESDGRIDIIEALHEATDGMLWIGTSGSGLSRYEPSTGTLEPYRHSAGNHGSLASDVVKATHMSSDGVLWVGTDAGLGKYDRSTSTFHHYRHAENDETTLSGDWVMNIHESANGILWLGTDAGLSRFDPVTETSQNFRHVAGDEATLSNDWISAVHESSDGTLWIGNDGGLDRIEKSEGNPSMYSVTRLRNQVGLERSAVLNILEDDDGRLWLGHISGSLARYDRDTGRVRYFRSRYGLAEGGLSVPAIRSRTGTLYWTTGRELISLRIDDLPPPGEPPKVHLTELRLFNEVLVPGPDEPLQKPLTETRILQLAHNQNDLTFGYVGIHYAAPEENRYVYRLLPYDHDWRTETDQRRATYTSLPPGDYTFEVRAANSDGVWNEEGASIRVVIAPPWWRTAWAYLLYGLLSAGVIAGLGRVQQRRLIRRERERALQSELEKARQIEAMNAQLEAKNEKLLELDHAKSRFFANISHEFRTPLTLLLGPLKDALDGAFGDLDDRLQRQHRLMQRNGRRLLRLINQLLDLSRLDSGHLTLRARRGDVVPLVKATVQSFASMAQRKNIALLVDSPADEIQLYFEPDKMEKILLNILSNAFKFTPPYGKINVSIEKRDDGSEQGYAEIVVKDTGRGIPAEELPLIFDRFHQVDGSATRSHEGAGIGLALTKELVELHGGSIRAESDLGFGTTVFVQLPLGNDHLSDEVLVDETGESSVDPVDDQDGWHEDIDLLIADVDASEPSDPDAPLILVVEDNADVRAYIRGHLAAHYRIEEAADGEDGLARARAVMPDLVIADVMMPKMDGYALCRALKSDKDLNHIPVVLLTAKASEQDKMEGLELGADDYLYKPFSMEELLVRVENLVEVRRRLRARFSDEVVVQPSEVVVSSADAAFLEQVREVVENHISETGFGVDQLASDVALSRRHLQRRLRALTKLSAASFIRTMRLERAAQLLEQRYGTVAEVAYEVGFKNADHFSRVFRQAFGVSPSQYPKDYDTSLF